MRFTDDERREVARRLRELKDPYWAGGNSSEASMDVMGVESYLRRNGLSSNLADLIEPNCDRDALLALADEMEGGFLLFGSTKSARRVFDFLSDKLGEYARRIREACGEAVG